MCAYKNKNINLIIFLFYYSINVLGIIRRIDIISVKDKIAISFILSQQSPVGFVKTISM